MELLDKINLLGLQDWSPEEQQEAKSLITEFACIFTMHDMDLRDMVPHGSCTISWNKYDILQGILS